MPAHPPCVCRRAVAEKSSWLSLAKSSTGSGQWRPARCKLVEEEEGCLLNIYVDVSVCLLFSLLKCDYMH